MNKSQITPVISTNQKRFNDNFNRFNDMDDLKSISVKRPSFPPSIDTKSLVTNLLKHKTKNPKMPNEFFIYRAALVKELKANNYKIKMTKLSTLASESWGQEKPSVKSAYRKLARETERQYLEARNEMLNSTKSSDNKDNDNDNDTTKKDSEKNKNLNNHLHSNLTSPTSKPELVIDYPIWPQQSYEYELTGNAGNDFTLIEDHSIFGMRPTYDDNALYLIPPQEKNDAIYSYIDNFSPYSSENSSPVSAYSAYWSHPSSPLSPSLPLNSTNTNTNINELKDSLQKENFFAPLPNSIYGLEEYNMNTLTINDLQNYPQFYEQTIDNNTFARENN